MIYLRRTMPESPRHTARVRGRAEEAKLAVEEFTANHVKVQNPGVDRPVKLSLVGFLSQPRYLLTLLGTAGCWFFFDYAYYGNSISTPLVLKTVVSGASLIQTAALMLVIFTVAAAPGYFVAFLTIDRIGHKRVQIIGFLMLGICFLLIGVILGITTAIVPCVARCGLSYFFTEFGPNTATFILAAELFPVSARTTRHGISAGMAKVGAFIGTFTVPLVVAGVGLAGVMTIAFATAVGMLLTLVLREPAGQSLGEASQEDDWQADAALTAAPAAG